MVGVGLVIPLQLPISHSNTITYGGVGCARDPLQLPTPYFTTITSGGGGGACDPPEVTHTTFYYNHFWWLGWGLRFPFSYPHHTLLQSLLVMGMGLVIYLQLPTPHSTTITSVGGVGAFDCRSITQTTFYYNHCWLWGWGL